MFTIPLSPPLAVMLPGLQSPSSGRFATAADGVRA
jgi:hypothetical protein